MGRQVSGVMTADTSAIIKDVKTVWGNSNGVLFFTDAGCNRIRRISLDGIMSTIAGTGSIGFNGDNIPTTLANLAAPVGITGDNAGVLYISANYRIRALISYDGGVSYVIYTVVGTGSYASTVGSSATPALSTALTSGKGVMMTSNYYLYFCEDLSRVRVTYPSASYFPTITPTTSPTTISPTSFATLTLPSSFTNQFNRLTVVVGNGTSGDYGDNGPATSAMINLVRAIWSDSLGNLYLIHPIVDIAESVLVGSSQLLEV